MTHEAMRIVHVAIIGFNYSLGKSKLEKAHIVMQYSYSFPPQKLQRVGQKHYGFRRENKNRQDNNKCHSN